MNNPNNAPQQKTPMAASKSTESTKSGKSWMIAAIVLLIGVVALGVTEFLTYKEISKKDNEITELKIKQEPATPTGQVETDCVTELPTDNIADTSVDRIAVNMDAVKDQLASDINVEKDLIGVYDPYIMAQSDQKYIVVDMSYGVKNSSGARAIYYKNNDGSSDSKWKQLWHGHQIVC